MALLLWKGNLWKGSWKESGEETSPSGYFSFSFQGVLRRMWNMDMNGELQSYSNFDGSFTDAENDVGT